MQESAEVIVPILENQSRRDGPNDEEQGGVIDRLAAREHLVARRAESFRRRTRRDHEFATPPGTNRNGADRAASLELILDVFDGGGC